MTVAQVEATMSMEELAEWEAYHFFEPFGAPAEDDRWRQMYSLYFSANTKQGTQMPDWLDRDPEETRRLRELETSKVTWEDQLEAFFMALVPSEDGAVVDLSGNSPPAIVEHVTLPYLSPAPIDQSMVPTG